MDTLAVKLHLTTPVHIGSARDNPDSTLHVYHSDALKSALYALGVSIYPEWEDAGYFFNGFRISSCFPFAGGEYFMPRPLTGFYLDISGVDDDRAAKKAKKIRFVSTGLIARWAADTEARVAVNPDQLSADGTFLFSDARHTQRVYTTGDQQRVNVSTENESMPFQIDRLYFHKRAGLYFLLDCPDEQLRKQLFTVLHLLSESGIGTDRTVGNGFFDFDARRDVGTFDLPGQGKSARQIPLGLYLPTRDEAGVLGLNDSAWHLVKRGGYIAGSEEAYLGLRKKNIFFFAEGSVLAAPVALQGKYVDLNPDSARVSHPVWRDGQPIFLNI